MKLVKEAAQEAAESVIDAYWSPGTFPVDPDVIARRMGISVTKARLPKDTSGFIRKVAGQDAQIFVDETDSAQRRRFTCAHELGHYVERTNPRHPTTDTESSGGGLVATFPDSLRLPTVTLRRNHAGR